MLAASSSSTTLPFLCALRGAGSICPHRFFSFPVDNYLRKLQCYRLYSSKISKSFNPSKPTSRQSYVDFVQERIKENENSKLPAALFRIITALKAKVMSTNDKLHPELKVLLDKSAAQLYFSCAENTNYLALCEEFALPDLFTSWFKLTLLHVWMVLFRLHVSLDAVSYQRFQHSILTTLWNDIDKRVKIVEEFSKSRHSAGDMKQVYALYLQTFFEYDEAFLTDDRSLAAAVWRNLYMEEKFEADHVSNVVRYIRATIAHLGELDSNEILVTGIEEWKIADEIKALHEK